VQDSGRVAGGQGGQHRFHVGLHVAWPEHGAPVVDEVAQVGVHVLEDLKERREKREREG
jgi:hypothetical protein